MLVDWEEGGETWTIMGAGLPLSLCSICKASCAMDICSYNFVMRWTCTYFLWDMRFYTVLMDLDLLEDTYIT